jgi:FKBP-type peptidyl-prolyl cis-trans isomerase
MKRIRFWHFSVIVLFLLAISCSSEQAWKEQEKQEISDYLKTLPDSTFILKPSGLYYSEVVAGTGRSPVTNNIAYFKYVGRFLNGVAFDSISTLTTPYEYLMGSGVIVAGIDEGLRYMKEGGKALLLTPSDLAYGRQGIYNIIPGYKPLLWEIELDSVRTLPGK